MKRKLTMLAGIAVLMAGAGTANAGSGGSLALYGHPYWQDQGAYGWGCWGTTGAYGVYKVSNNDCYTYPYWHGWWVPLPAAQFGVNVEAWATISQPPGGTEARARLITIDNTGTLYAYSNWVTSWTYSPHQKVGKLQVPAYGTANVEFNIKGLIPGQTTPTALMSVDYYY